MELQQAYEIIGVDPDTTHENLDKQYDMLARREKDQQRLDEIHQAYRMIYEDLLKVHETDLSFRKKVENFLYHYKKTVIFGTLILILTGSLLYTLIDSQIQKRIEANLPPPDLEIMIFGNYADEDLSLLEQRMLDLFPAWDAVKLQLIYSPTEPESQADMAAMQKSQVTMATETPDIYILDANNFERFVHNGPFLPLDQIDEVLSEDMIDPAHLKYFQKEADDHEHLYGIDLIDNDLFTGLAMEKSDKIAVIREDTGPADNSFDLLLKLLTER